MSRYDSEGYNRGRRQILGYSRLAQGGADQARARANQRVYESQDHLYTDGRTIREARQRAQRVARAKREGTFEDTKDTYNEEAASMGSDAAMDNAGTIKRQPKTYTGSTSLTPKKPARAKPMSYARPAGQKIAETDPTGSIAMTEPAGLLDMARKARRRLVIR